jgi:hypothetical protein
MVLTGVVGGVVGGVVDSAYQSSASKLVLFADDDVLGGAGGLKVTNTIRSRQ